MEGAKDVAQRCHSQAEVPDAPRWFDKLRQEFRSVREEVQGLRQEVRSLRGEQDEDRNLDIEEAAQIASISERKLQTLIHSGEVPSLKIGRRRLIPRKAFKAWLRSKVE